MRGACLVWLIAGCGFTGAPSEPPDDPGDPGAGSGSSTGSGSPAGNTGSCDATGATLRLCVSFGDHPIDLLAPPHTIAEATGILPIQGVINGIAGVFDNGSHLRFAESPDFDVHDLTLDVWMSAASRPPDGKRAWIVDNNTQYFASYEDDGSVRCGIGSTAVTSKASVSTKHWHHIACTYSASDQALRVYVDGDVAGCANVNPIPQGGTDGIAIGANYGAGGFKENYLGQLDMLHLYASALSASEVCSAAGRTGCDDRCPD
jgi:hypothetical protein